jgi:hypothetical protein
MQVTMPLTTHDCQGRMPAKKKKFVSGKQSSDKFVIAAQILVLTPHWPAN